jgi:protein-S-isoprenylcysteine O-methyltransferase Ste14
MFPVLVVMYVRLAITEEKWAEREFGEEWAHYASHTPRFIPNFGDKQADRHHHA